LLRAFVAQLRLAQEHSALEKRAASAAELAEANSLRTALLAAVSHDLRTPLASIKAAATSLLSHEVAWDANETAEFAKTIDADADRLTHLVTNLLDMSRIQSGSIRITVRPVSLDDVLYPAVGALGPASARVVIDVARRLPPIETDAGLLERVIANLVDNALTHAPADSVVRVEADAVDDRVDIRVIDQGPGIPPAQRDAVFEPFQRLGDGGGKPGGVGLGLAVSRGFMNALKGEIYIDDTPGGGTTMVVSLLRKVRP
jgi:two-component system sensor histidine kinase KdpD